MANFDVEYLRERVTTLEFGLEKNKVCAEQMDGNASDENEDFLVESMKSEIPGQINLLKKVNKDISSIECGL